jgi:RNA polymerase sigma factor (TIGR02999 family)
VHEAYLRLAGVRAGRFQNRVHFFGAAAQTMRRILVDHARRRGARKRSAGAEHLDLERAAQVGIDPDTDLLALDRALENLTEVSPKAARVVELRFFGGLSIEQAAEFLDVGPSTVKRHWSFARAWLSRELEA